MITFTIVVVVVASLWEIYAWFENRKRDRLLKGLSAGLEDLIITKAPRPTIDPDVTPTFVSGPSCAFCKLPVLHEQPYVSVDAVIPMVGGDLPVSMIIHDYHTEINVPIAPSDFSIL
jgi:hypothetical protein